METNHYTLVIFFQFRCTFLSSQSLFSLQVIESPAVWLSDAPWPTHAVWNSPFESMLCAIDRSFTNLMYWSIDDAIVRFFPLVWIQILPLGAVLMTWCKSCVNTIYSDLLVLCFTDNTSHVCFDFTVHVWNLQENGLTNLATHASRFSVLWNAELV